MAEDTEGAGVYCCTKLKEVVRLSAGNPASLVLFFT